LLVSTPPWLADLEADGYAALADFARSHGAVALAAEALLAGAGRFPSRKLPFTVSAGMLLLNSDSDQARELLESARAMSPSFNARVEIGFLILRHPAASAAPIQIPAEAASRLAAIDDDAVVSDFLARQRARANDLDAAVPWPRGLWPSSPTSGSFSITWPTCSPAARCPRTVVLMIRSARPSSRSALSISSTGGTALPVRLC
jgi:hypothetical protein